ncbi:MAG: hypothetical protein RI907_385 [Pseudomonadota bacterium]|jgi:PfaD family protein
MSSPRTADPFAFAGAPLGKWQAPADAVRFDALDAAMVRATLRRPVALVRDPQAQAVGVAWAGEWAAQGTGDAAWPLVACLGPVFPEWLGDRRFCAQHGLRFPYIGGSMARGIASVDLAIALAEMGAMGMFGSAGLSLAEVEAGLIRLSVALDARGLPWGCNLIHTPNESGAEDALVDLLMRRGVRTVEASAFMQLTPALVRYACSGLTRAADGSVMRRHQVFAKVSREEVARPFMSPAPQAMLAALQAAGHLTAQEAALAAEVPVAEQVIVESDSGGHTDNRPLGALFPVIARLRDQLVAQHGFRRPLHVGAAGGLGTPQAVAAAFALGAAFVVVGSAHQAAVESGVSDAARAMLAEAGPADVAMTASADMFEQGVKVQVLSRGTMMAVRGNELYELYRRHASLEELPSATRQRLEKTTFGMTLDAVWAECERFFAQRDPAQLARAQADAKHRMALVFRWYLGQASRWPLVGEPARRTDYQIWCGPAMGAFNRWVAGSFLAQPAARHVQQIALNLLEGAAVVTRAQQLRSMGVAVQASAFDHRPVPLRVQAD